jgi:hypothetical protein
MKFESFGGKNSRAGLTFRSRNSMQLVFLISHGFLGVASDSGK